MTSTRNELLTFLADIGKDKPEAVQEAIEIFEKNPEIGTLYAEQSPKFVEIFTILAQTGGKSDTSTGLFKIISMIFDCCFKNANVYFGQLHFLADSMIRRYLTELVAMLGRKQNKLAMKLILQSARVHHTHCRELFSTLDFSTPAFKRQSRHDKGARDEYVKLATVFLENQEVSLSFMSTKYYLASIWRELKDDEPETMRAFLTALMTNIQRANLSTRCWVFSDLTLKNIAQFPLEKDAGNKNPKSLVYDLLDSMISCEESIILEDPKRTYCIAIPNIDPPPKNLNFLNFIRELDPWKKPGHRDTAVMIFKKSPDLISHYFSRQNNDITPDVTLKNLSSLYFINSVISLPWPEFLPELEEEFNNNERSLDLLFESIIPSILDRTRLTNIVERASVKEQPSKGKKDKNEEEKIRTNVLIIKAVLVLLTNAVKKFKALPSFLKTPQAFAKLSARIPNLNTVLASKSPLLLTFVLKLLLELDSAIPFFIQDNQTATLTNLVKNIKKQEPLIQLELIRVAGHFDKPTSFIVPLSAIVTDESMNMILRKEALLQVTNIVSQSIAFDNCEKEAAIWVAYALKHNLIDALFNSINAATQHFEKYASTGVGSYLCNAVVKKPLQKVLPLVAKFHGVEVKDLVSGPIEEIEEPEDTVESLLKEFNWFDSSEAIVKLCSLEPTTESVAAISALLIMCPELTVDKVLNSPAIRERAFTGSRKIDKMIALAVELNGSIDDDLTLRFINNKCSRTVTKRISPFVDKKIVSQLIGKLLRDGLDIREIISSQEKFDLEHFDEIWQWVFEGFSPIDLDTIRQLPEEFIGMIEDETIILDILRTIYLKKDEELFSHLPTYSTNNDKINVLLTEMGREVKIDYVSIPLSYIRNSTLPSPADAFENSQYEWSFDYILRQIEEQPFEREIKKVSKDHIKHVLKIYMEHYSTTVSTTFANILKDYIIRNPEEVTSTPTECIDFYTRIAEKVMKPELLVKYTPEQLKGVCNILCGYKESVPMRTLLFLSVSLSDFDPFYQLLEYHINPEDFLFVTGEAARSAIQLIVAKQSIHSSNLSRNVAYLQPFHLGHTISTETARFRFLLKFANYLLTERIITAEIFMESGAISIVLRALSSENPELRRTAYCTLSEFYYENDFKEWSKQNTVRAFIDSIVNATSEDNMRFSALQTHFFAAFASVIMKPEHNLYMRVIKYITSTSTAKYTHVPLFESIFDKPRVQYRAERNYILKMLQKGITESEDLKLLTHGRVCERLMNVYASPLSDMVTRRQILDILCKVSSIDRINGLMGWIYSVLLESFSEPHASALVTIAVNAVARNESDSFILKRICKAAINNQQISASLDKEIYNKAKSFIE